MNSRFLLPLCMAVIVITSYSIHYTKLYEGTATVAELAELLDFQREVAGLLQRAVALAEANPVPEEGEGYVTGVATPRTAVRVCCVGDGERSGGTGRALV